jgi:hypothetical protein
MYHQTIMTKADRKAAAQARFVAKSRAFWSNYGGPLIDRAVVILVPTAILAPSLIAWLK